ncbi:trypsin-like serine protease [Brucella sp. NBRC 12950]|uniref:trypsin-like serine protease n=1 Tax=Brucella sp. NBRC 12950 TaxID=2994518 RepID=UPI0025554A43|nr:trypsin-like serine protease [Brucella sp. NBRC 12950]
MKSKKNVKRSFSRATPLTDPVRFMKRVAGGPDAPFIPWVVKIKCVVTRDDHGNPTLFRAGTGILLSDMWVLTTRHGLNNAQGEIISLDDVLVIATNSASIPGSPPPYRQGLQVVEAQYPETGDLIALRLARPYRLDDYAPIDMELVDDGSIINRRVSMYGYGRGNSLRLGTAWGIVAREIPDEHYPPSRQFDFLFEHEEGSGYGQGGDSGGPVLTGYLNARGTSPYELVVGLYASTDTLVPPTFGGFVLLSDYRDFVQRFTMPSVEAGPSSSINAISVGWRSVNNCSDFVRLEHLEVLDESKSHEKEASTQASPVGCNLIEAYRVFYKRAIDGDSWDNALSKQFDNLQQHETETITLPDNSICDEREIWAVTVLPVARGSDTGANPNGSGANGKPLAGSDSNFYAQTSCRLSLPLITSIEANTAYPEAINITWKNSASPFAGTVLGYTLFYLATDAVPDKWEGCESMSTFASGYETTTLLLLVEKRKNYVFLVLPITAGGGVGMQSNGYPHPGVFKDDQVVCFGPPGIRFQEPRSGDVLVVEVGSYGSFIMAAVNFSDYAKFEWFRSEEQNGEYSKIDERSSTSGRDTPFLIFGTASHPAVEMDSGWYKLIITNAFGAAETAPVQVSVR